MVKLYPSMLDPFIQAVVGRRDTYARQLAKGRYTRVGAPLTYQELFAHLAGKQTLGTYLINEHNQCTFAVFDSDQPTGLLDLAALQTTLLGWGIPASLEQSRRGGHLWVFLSEPLSPACLRAWLLPFCPEGVEFYPKQDQASWDHPGCLMRLPLGVHQRSGERYPFVQLESGQPVPLFSSVLEALPWFARVEQARVPPVQISGSYETKRSRQRSIPFKKRELITPVEGMLTIRDWCASQDAITVISRYVALDDTGMGCCPFGWHHDDGMDSHPSFWVYRPVPPDICCWYCHAWQQGGSLFDFLRLYQGLEARELWHRILCGMSP